MVVSTINVFLATFSGLGLPPTISLPVNSATTIAELWKLLSHRLPQPHNRLVITTNSDKELSSSSAAPLFSLLSSEHDTFIPLRLWIPLGGGKGGFGSQLRAAGGRMSSRRKKNQGENNSSNRNLDGRRLRTVAEAKALAEYLAVKPDMERKEKEARRKRWEEVVELAEKREEEIKNGSKSRIDGRWVEDKDDAGERAREAVVAAMMSGRYYDNLSTKPGETLLGSSAQPDEGNEINEIVSNEPDSRDTHSTNAPTSSRSFIDFDEDEYFMSDDDDVQEA